MKRLRCRFLKSLNSNLGAGAVCIKQTVPSLQESLACVLFAICSFFLQNSPMHGMDESDVPLHRHAPRFFFDGEAEQQLCLAIQCGDVSWVQGMIAAGANPHAVGEYGVTPVYWAFLHKQERCYEYLLSLGCDITVALDLPPNLWPDVRLCEYSNGDSLLIQAARRVSSTWWLSKALKYNNFAVCRNPHSGFDVVHSFLSQTIEKRWRPDVAEEFVTAGIDLNALDDRGDSVAVRALENGWYDAVLWFLEHGTSPDTYNREHWQLIHHVAMEYRVIQGRLKAFPESQQEWEASDRKRAWEQLVRHLRERGYPLTEALIDLERRQQLVDELPYLVWRRLQRDDRYCGENGREFREYVKRRFPEDHPYATWLPPEERK
jgi:ankyrin repeat protein